MVVPQAAYANIGSTAFQFNSASGGTSEQVLGSIPVLPSVVRAQCRPLWDVSHVFLHILHEYRNAVYMTSEAWCGVTHVFASSAAILGRACEAVGDEVSMVR